MKRLEAFLLALDRMPVHHRSLPSNLSGFPNNMLVPILTFSLKFNVSESSTNRVYVNQFIVTESIYRKNYRIPITVNVRISARGAFLISKARGGCLFERGRLFHLSIFSLKMTLSLLLFKTKLQHKNAKTL